jgi:hypothetical protein
VEEAGAGEGVDVGEGREGIGGLPAADDSTCRPCPSSERMTSRPSAILARKADLPMLFSSALRPTPRALQTKKADQQEGRRERKGELGAERGGTRNSLNVDQSYICREIGEGQSTLRVRRGGDRATHSARCRRPCWKRPPLRDRTSDQQPG